MSRLFSIIIPSYNRRDSLLRTLKSLQQIHVPDLINVEVIVVLDGCTDGSYQAVEQYQHTCPFTIVVLSQEQQGPSAARNLGLSNANGDYIAFTDDDVVPASDWLIAHLDTLDQFGINAISIGPIVLPDDTQLSPWVEWEMITLDKQYAALKSGDMIAGAKQFYTANVALSTSLLKSTGNFNTAVFRAEDIELGYRLAKKGADFQFTASAPVYHYAKRTFESWKNIAVAYGETDIAMTRQFGHTAVETAALSSLNSRHWATRYFVKASCRFPSLHNMICNIGQGIALLCYRLGLCRLSYAAYSALFNMLYFSGVCVALGGRRQFSEQLAHIERSTSQ